MEQYIPKSALVAEIKRRKELVSDPILSGDDLMIGERNAYFNLLSFIDTIEVKEVDLEKEINDYFITVDLYEGEKITENTFRKIAKHFFELGMQVSNKSQNVWHNADEKLPLGVIVVSNYGHLHIGWATDEGDGIEDEHGCLITKTYQKWAREKDLT